jgi:hypothetical protein
LPKEARSCESESILPTPVGHEANASEAKDHHAQVDGSGTPATINEPDEMDRELHPASPHSN